MTNVWSALQISQTALLFVVLCPNIWVCKLKEIENFFFTFTSLLGSGTGVSGSFETGGRYHPIGLCDAYSLGGRVGGGGEGVHRTWKLFHSLSWNLNFQFCFPEWTLCVGSKFICDGGCEWRYCQVLGGSVPWTGSGGLDAPAPSPTRTLFSKPLLKPISLIACTAMNPAAVGPYQPPPYASQKWAWEPTKWYPFPLMRSRPLALTTHIPVYPSQPHIFW